MHNTRILALAVMSLVTAASFAGAQAPTAGAHGGRHAVGGGMDGRRGGERGALHGLKLSDAEQASVKAIHAKYVTESSALRQTLKPAMQEARALRQKGDTAGLRALWEKNKANRDEVQALQGRQQAEIRAALTVENQKLFDANVQERTMRRAEWSKSGRTGKAGRHGARHGAFRGQAG